MQNMPLQHDACRRTLAACLVVDDLRCNEAFHGNPHCLVNHDLTVRHPQWRIAVQCIAEPYRITGCQALQLTTPDRRRFECHIFFYVKLAGKRK